MGRGLAAPGRRAGRRSAVIWSAAALIAVLSATAVAVVGLPHEARAQEEADSDDWRPCGGSGGNRIERVEIVLALDRSGSLEHVDPNGTRRRRAVHGTRERLVELQESVAGLLAAADSGIGFEIDVSLIAFDSKADVFADFARITPDHPSNEAVDRAVDRGGNTDYGPPVQEALEQFAGSASAGSTTTCRVLVLFTDGILDPYDTANGRRPERQDQAETHVANLLADLCSPESGTRQYRQRLDRLGVSTYVVVLRGPAFDFGGGATHLDALARASKQTILGLTGHVAAPLMEGVTAASGCESWSEVRAGKVIEIESIESLAAELAAAVGEVWLALRQPRLSCTEPVGRTAAFEGDWPYALAARGPGERRVCTLTPPLDGEVELTYHRSNAPPYATFYFDDGAERYFDRTLTAGDAAISFDVVSDELDDERDYRLGGDPPRAAEDVSLEVIAVWHPTPQPAWPDQPPEVRWSEWVSFDLLDRERYVLDMLVDCRVHQRAAWTDEPSGVRATADGLCSLQAPPAGEFEITLVESGDDNRLRWAMTVAGVGSVPGEPVLLAPGEDPVSLGARSQVLERQDIPPDRFEDGVRFVLRWRSPVGEILLDSETLTEAAIEARPPVVEMLECAGEPEVAAVIESAGEAPALVVDTGCLLVSRGGGTVGVAAAGDLQGVPWRLVVPRSSDEVIWPVRDDLRSPGSEILQQPSAPDSPLFVAVEHQSLGDFAGEVVDFTLVAQPTEQSAALPEPQRATRSVAVYVPFPQCPDRVDAVRVDVEVPDGGGFEQRARVRNLCEVVPPPTGRLAFRLTGGGDGVVACWGASRIAAGRPECGASVTVEPGDEAVGVGSLSGPLPSTLVGPAEASVHVEVVWESAKGRSTVLPRRVAVAVPEPALKLIECSADAGPAVTNAGAEIPEGPILVDTGCSALAHPAGSLGVAVEGTVAGVPWLVAEPLLLPPGSGEQRIFIRSDSPLPNEPIRGEFGFELVAWIEVDGLEPPPSRALREVQFSGAARVRIRCDGAPVVLWDGPEVPEGPLVVDTGCNLVAPREAGTVEAIVGGAAAAGVPWRLSEPVRLSPGDDDRRILIETDGPLPNRRYDGDIDFSLAAVSTYEEEGRPAVEQSVGTGGASLALDLRARPNVAAAIPIAAGLLAAALVAVWLVVWFWARRTVRLPAPRDLQVRTRSVKFRREGPAGLGLPEGVAEGLRDAAVTGSRRALRIEGLTLRLRMAPWNLRRLVSGDPAELRAAEGGGRLVAWRSAAGQSGGLMSALRVGVVVLALDPTAGDRTERRGQLWVLRARGSTAPKADAIDSAIAAAARDLARKLPTDVQRRNSPKG